MAEHQAGRQGLVGNQGRGAGQSSGPYRQVCSRLFEASCRHRIKPCLRLPVTRTPNQPPTRALLRRTHAAAEVQAQLDSLHSVHSRLLHALQRGGQVQAMAVALLLLLPRPRVPFLPTLRGPGHRVAVRRAVRRRHVCVPKVAVGLAGRQ